MRASHCYDVVIVGAGASGLSCASTLHKQKVDLLMVEARDRIGGRILTKSTEEKSSLPLELGAEFIHAASPLVLELLNKTGQTFYDAQFGQHRLKGKKLVHQEDFWEEYEKVLNFSRGKTDRSMQDFIKAHDKALTTEMKSFLIGYVEGFEGADVSLMSERGFLDSEKNKRDLNGLNDFRMTGGYAKVLEGLFKESNFSKKIRYDHPVVSVLRENNHYTLTCRLPSGRTKKYHAEKVVVSAPLAVLRGAHPQSRIQWEAPVQKLVSSLSSLHMGHVQRLCFVFKERFWEKLDNENPICFMRASSQDYFPTWWTLSPMRTPYLMAWQGGPKALEMSAWSDEERIQIALKTLSKLTQHSVPTLRKYISSVHQHNWSQDPYSMGAYTYPGVSNKKISAHPNYKKEFWLTGEAFAPKDGEGTVHGALEHGHQTALQILKSLKITAD